MKKIIYLLIFLLFIPSVLSIESHEISYTLDNDIVKVNHVFVTNQSIQLLVPEDAYNFYIVADEKATNFTLSRTDKHKQVSVPLSSRLCKIEISYLTSSYLEKGKHSYFVGAIEITQSTKNLSIYLTLPEKALLARPLTALNPPVNPYPNSIETTGRKIMIKWVDVNLNPDNVFSMFVVYEEDKSFLWYFIMGSFIILFIGFMFYFLIKYKNIFSIKYKKYSHLLESEQAIVNALLKAENHTMWQKKLQITVGFTKSKLSRKIRNMEQRGLVKKIPYGATNKIKLITTQKKSEEK